MINIKKKTDCCGCGACVQICPVPCIVFRDDGEGFPYPVVDEPRCIQCGLCDQVCPVLGPLAPEGPSGTYAAVNPDDDVRRASSSGGIFTMLAGKVISGGGVVFGVKFDEEWNAVHTAAGNMEQLPALRGSKYLQSRTEDTFRQAEKFLEEGREVLFTGTSCQTAGFRKFLRRGYPNLTVADVVCHSVPSPKVWQEYLSSALDIQEKATGVRPVITHISMRGKSRGWKRYSINIAAGDGQPLVDEPFTENPFMRGFLRDIYSRPVCRVCPAKGFRAGSDLTIADFWGIGRQYPGLDDDKGVSLVFTNTPKGEEMLEAIGAELTGVPYDAALAGNPGIEHPALPSPHRREFFRMLGQMPFPELVERSLRKNIVSRIRRLGYKLIYRIKSR